MIKEDGGTPAVDAGPTNAAGRGAVAGIGVGPKGEPGVHPKHQPKRNRTPPTSAILGYFRRKAPNMMAEDQIDEMDTSRFPTSRNIEDRRTGLNPSHIMDKFSQRMKDRQSGDAKEREFRGGDIPSQSKSQAAIGAAKDAVKDVVSTIRDRLGSDLGKSSGKPANVSNIKNSNPTAGSIPISGGSLPGTNGSNTTPRGTDNSGRTPRSGHQTFTNTPGTNIDTKTPSKLYEESFAGAVVFEVSSSVFHNAKMEKRKGKHWRTYLDECDALAEIREYANKHPKKAIILRNENTGEMTYCRYGKRKG